MSWRVVSIVAAIAAACAALCGVLPASVASRTNVVDVLARGVTPAARQLRLRRVFATGVIALTCLMLVSLGLVGRSLHNVLNVNPGFEPRGVLTLSVVVQSPNPERASFLSALHSALEARVGPRSVSVINELPLTHDGGRRFVRIHRPSPYAKCAKRARPTSM